MIVQSPPIPWGNAFGPLSLATPLYALPRFSCKNIPKIYGDGNKHPNEHIVSFYIVCEVLGVEHEDFSIRLFIETLQGVAVDWFHNLSIETITNWATLQTKFEKIFKPVEDAHALLDQITTMRKDS